MADLAPRNAGHRRAKSEILRLPDDLGFDDDPIEEDLVSMYLNMNNFASGDPSLAKKAENFTLASGERERIGHKCGVSMDGSTSVLGNLMASGPEGSVLVETKKGMSAAELSDLALVDPKRAKRIWSNRQSAARSKERKMRYIQELELKMQFMQTQNTKLSAQLVMSQRDTSGLTAQNNELKLRLQSMEKQIQLQGALNDALRQEVHQLKGATGIVNVPNGGPLMSFGPNSFGPNQHLNHHNHPMPSSLLNDHQLQQLLHPHLGLKRTEGDHIK